jgi:hypothetical protein
MRESVPPLPQYIFMAWCLVKQSIRLPGVALGYAQGLMHLYLYLYFYPTAIYECFKVAAGPEMVRQAPLTVRQTQTKHAKLVPYILISVPDFINYKPEHSAAFEENCYVRIITYGLYQ